MSAQAEIPSKTKRVPFKEWKLVQKDDRLRQVTPTVYTQEMLQSTEERFANNKEITLPRVLELLDMSKSSQHKFSFMDIDQPIFQPYPSELVFQNFTPTQTYSLQLSLFNNDKVSRKVRLELQDSEFFQVTGLKSDGCKVAPGMSAAFYVCFTPQENKDYQHSLVFVTERERFEVPIYAIGPRAILDFRDEIQLPACPMKYSTERTHLVRNIGNCTAKFMLQTQRPFSVTPTCGTLDVGESMQVIVSFNPKTMGDHIENLILHYHSGEDIYISLYGLGEELSIQLQPDFVPLQKTYISLSTVHTVSFTNTHDIPLKFFWTMWPSLQEEALSMLRDGLVLSQRDEAERDQLLFQCESDPTAIHALPQLSSALQRHRSQCLQDNGITFSHDWITVEPAEGEIWPNMTTQFFIVFKPEEAKLCEQTIYFDITGCESRLPLTVVGEAIGPQIQFSYNMVDMRNVFVSDKGSYELELSNVGLIDAPFSLSLPDTSFGRCFTVAPREGVVSPGARQLVEVTFSSHILGDFSEDLLLTVTGQPEPPKVTFRGCVIGPTFHFDVLELDFGDVGFGFPKTLTCTLCNTSCVPMSISLRVLGDGLGPPSVSYDKQLSDTSRSNWQASVAKGCHARPMELTIKPASGSVAPMSDFPIEVKLCSNTAKRYWLAMAVDVEGVGNEIGTLPINARCVVPDIVVETPLLNFQRCFLDYPYEQKVRLTNPGTVATCYGVLDKKNEDNSSIHCGSSAPRGVIYPQSSVEIPVFLLAKATGTLQHSLRVAVFGSSQAPLEVILSSVGQGPTVHVQSSQLDFGKIRVLTDSTRLLQLLNQSPIPASFTARMTGKKSFWRVEPSEGEVSPGGQLDLSVVANLKDTLRFEDRLEVSIRDSKTHTVPLSATGTGTTITTDRPFAPSLDLGTYFSPGSCQYHFKLTNQGLRTQRLYWRIDGSYQTRVGDLSGRTVLPPIPVSKKDSLGDGSSLKERAVFSLSPSRVELFPGFSIDMVLSGSLDSPKIVQERLICQAIVGSQSTNEQIMSVDITCRFVATMLSISPKELNFYMSKAKGKRLTPLYEKLTVANVSTRTLSLLLLLAKPFSLCEAAGVRSSITKQSFVLEEGGQAELWVCYDPAHYCDQMSQIIDEVLEINYQGHPQQDLVKLHAEIHFPNIDFSSTTVDFGCVLNYTETRKEICVTNCSPMSVSYRWTFLVDEELNKPLDGVEKPISPLIKTDYGRNSFVSLRPDGDEDEQSDAWSAVGAFDILPSFGHLQPGEKQKLALCFYAQENVNREITALCHVEEGPTYKLRLRGEASVINYSVEPTVVDFGRQMFDHEAEALVTLKNTGKVSFTYSIVDPHMEVKADGVKGRLEVVDGPDSPQARELWPGRPTVIPATGYIEAGAEQTLRVFYLPGVPDVFEKELQLKVAFLPPQVITLTGEGIFPRINLNLPTNLSDKRYSEAVQQARSTVEAVQEFRRSSVETNSTLTFDGLFHMEVERRLVKENALTVIASLLELGDLQEASKKLHRLSKFLLPEYVLDFGHVILGQVLSQTVTVTNNGTVAVSFQANPKALAGTGFTVEFERVKNLPCGETQTFTVKFDAQGSSVRMGDVSVVMPIQVLHGPTVQVRLCSVVTEPSLTISSDVLQFDTIPCGMCQMRTIQLFNHKTVPCCWSMAEEINPLPKVDKFLPFYQRKKMMKQLRPPPAVFEMTPCCGLLSPAERINVQIKFSPAEGMVYCRQLVISMAESSQQIHMTARGVGEEPQLEFCPSELQLGPCLPNSTQAEAEVTVKNPCSFPIEFYSLELDTQYMEEEKVLSIMQGYDEKNELLLPPRAAGESLPEELQEYYVDYCTQLAEKAQQQKEAVDEGKNDTNDPDSVKPSEEGAQESTLHAADLLLCNIPREGSGGKQGQLEITPVARAIARHMSVDLSPEGFAARNRTGIAIIVYGGPLTGKSKVAHDLAQHYGGACLSVDGVVTDVLMNGSSAVSLRARQLYNAAAAQYSEKKAREPAVPSDEVRETGSAAADRSAAASQASADAPTKLGRRGSVRSISKSSQGSSEPHSALWLGGDVTTLRNILPEQVLVDILSERFQQRDCHRGIIMCGLDSVYIQPVATTLQVVLKAINNRKHIYAVNLSCSYAVLKARDKLKRLAMEVLRRGRAAMQGSWLQGLDEEECDALPEEEKEKLMERYRVKLRQMKLREKEKTQKEQQEKNQELEMKKIKEEELKKKGKKPGKKDPKEASKRKTTQDGKQSSTDATRKSSGSNSKESLADARETPISSEVHYSKEAEEESKVPQTVTYEAFQPTEVKVDKPKPRVDQLQTQFNAYEQSQEQVVHILRHWDRTLLMLLVPVPNEDSPTVSEEAVSEKRTSQSKKSKKATNKVSSPMTPQLPVVVDSEKKEKLPPREIIPYSVLNLTGEDCPSVAEVLSATRLPSLEQVLDDMGIGPSGPPIPPPVTLSIVPFPKSRQQADEKQICACFTFLIPSKSDEAKKDSEEDEPSPVKDERATTPFKKKGSAVAREPSKRGRESQKTKRRSRISSLSTCSETSQVNNQATLEQKRQQSLMSFRWVVPAKGEISLRIWFYRDSPGKFEQTFNFELLGTQRTYQLPCKGICSYPSICTDYRTLFPNCKAVPQRQEGIRKTYVINPEYFEFGHLLCGKTRDRFKETKYQENTEKLLIYNDSGLEVEVQFQFQQDTSASTYLVDPSMMILKPEEKQEVTVWAYPTKVGLMRDSLLCLIKENPEIITIDFSCWGVRPELKMDTRHFHFDRILLHRQDSRTVTLRNRTALPVSWRLQGVEELGDEFTVPQDHGIIPPKSSLPVTLHFRAKRPLHIKKVLRLEVSDVEKILGVVHTENLQVSAEAYEIALDISPDGLLDFGTMRVFEENKLSLKMKNQGKHEIAYKFIFPQTDIAKSNLLSVSPKAGSLKPYEKSTTVQIVCSPTKEVCIKEKPLLSFEVIEPSLGKGGETIAILAIKVSVTSVFSSYKITPACDVNFGPLIYGNRKSQAVVIKNTGLFETQFTISRMVLDPALMDRPGGSSKRAGQGSQSERTSATNGTGRRETFQKEARPAQSILTMGVFTVAPCVATLQPGGQQVVTVNCAAEQLGKWNMGLLIDISDRDPVDHPRGIPYRLMAEICKPGILLDMPSIFEEHYICPNSSQLTSEKYSNAKGIYIQEENKFLFNKVLVGQTTRARFKLTNNGKVPCMLNFSVRHIAARALRNMEVFELATTSLNIPSQSHMFAEVTFTPQTIQLYNAVFEVAMEGASRMTPPFRSKLLEFDLVGEGNLPSVCVLRPALRSREGTPMLQFRRVLVGRRCTLPLVLLNDGIVPAQVQLHMVDEDEVFTLKASPANTCTSVQFARLEGNTESESQPGHRVTITLNIGEQVELEVSFGSDKPLNVKTKVLLQVADNLYNETAIQVSGEAYQEVVSMSNISRSLQEVDAEDGDEGNCEVLNFGDCYVGRSYRESFTMTNHTDSQVVKFRWPSSGPHISFSPKVGHIHAGCSKEMTVTFCSSEPVTLGSQLIKCKICQVQFQQPLDQVVDWDDKKRTVQWLDSTEQTLATPEPHVKNKVINTDPEPSCTVVEDSKWDLELCIKGVCDYVQYSCNTEAIHFNDTMLYQSRLYQLQLINQGKVKFDYSFQIFMDSSVKTPVPDRDDELVTSRPCSRAGRESTEIRPASALASVISALTVNPAQSPFTVEPSIGTIEPGIMQSFKIRFAPLEVGQFEATLACSIPNLQEEYQAPCIPLFGRCLLPYCHFDLEDSDYPGGTGGDPEFRGLQDSNTRVIQFNAVGVSQPLTRRFSVLNPTNKAYLFKWTCENTGACPFRCLTPSGTVQPGKKVELCFEYVPEQIDLVAQSSWNFVIDSLSMSIPFICVGTSREPLVYFSKAYFEFGELLVGQRAEKLMDLVNVEEQPFGFFIVQSSLLCDDQQSSLTVHPMTGTVAPKDRLPLSVRFTPCRDGHVSFRMVLKVRNKTEPLAIAVKADCFAMTASLQVSMPGTDLRDVNPNHPDTLDFGKVEIAENHVCYFVLTNMARFSLEVSLEATGPCELLQYLEATPKRATTDIGTQLQLSLSFCPKNVCNLQNIVLSIKVKLGPTFIFVVQGTAVEPCLEFSFTKFNFGKCFLYSPGMVPACQTLVMSNKGAKGISVQSQFKENAFLEIDFQPDIVPPGGVVEVPICFYPRELCHYHKKITFIFNSCITKDVDILGQGVEMKLEVEDLKHKKVRLRSVILGQKVEKQIGLINRSPVDVSFTLLVTNTLLDTKELSVSPSGELNLKGNGGSCKIYILFTPLHHIPSFTAELQADCAGLLHPLLTIQGCCQGVKVHLAQDRLAFGAIVQRCHSKRRIVMINTGDIGGRFQWKTGSFPPELSITPTKGYICPGMEVPFEVTFAPVELSEDIRYENLSCFVEGAPSPVTLTVTGSCAAASTSKEVVNFVCPVRGSLTQTLSVMNPTNQQCTISPVIEGEQWSAAPTMLFEPLQNKAYVITYQPLTMTVDGQKHQGSIFFSFPDGTGMLYSLQGTTEPPKAEDTVVHQLPAKTQHSQLLTVHNWLSEQQRFHVVIDFLRPEKPDPTVSLKGVEHIDVPSLATRKYKLSFYTYKEGQYQTRVTFRNVTSGEYMFYLVTFEATSPGVLSTIKLVTAVRRVASASVSVENPLSTPVCFTTECKSPDISAPPQTTVPGHSKGVLNFEYQPLRAGNFTVRLSLCNNELGFFHFELQLRALPPPPEKTVYFTAYLGSSYTALATFINYSRIKTEYACRMDSTDFFVDRSVSASPGFQAGSETSVEVVFEPHKLGEVKGQLNLSSGFGGEYIFPLHGVCLPPKAQGPFSIRSGRHITIPFKNVFLQTTAFSFQVDKPYFTVRGVEPIPSKKTQNITVAFEMPLDGSQGPWLGKLTVSSQRSEGHNKPCSWVFYLRGFDPSSS